MDHVLPKIAHHSVFDTGGMEGGVTSQKFAHFTHLEKFLPHLPQVDFLPTPKRPTFKDISGFFPKIRFFPGCITFLSLRNQKLFEIS